MGFLDNLKNNFQRYGALTQIIVINAVLFLTVNVVGNLSHLQLGNYVALPIGAEAFLFRFWTLFTYMFTHFDFWHLFGNMFLFYFMAQMFFTIMGERQLWYVYVMSGLAGGALTLVTGLLMPAFFANSFLVGASAAVLGVGAVLAIFAPNYPVYLFGILEMRYKFFFLFIFILTTVVDLSVNTGGKLAHMGGTLFGILYGYSLKQGNDLSKFRFSFRKQKPLKVVSHNRSYTSPPAASGNDEQRMNDLLDKISRSGYDSLNKSEKEELFKLSQKK